MTIPPIGGLGGIQLAALTGTTPGATTATTVRATGVSPAAGLPSATTAAEALPAEGASGVESAGGVESASGAESRGGESVGGEGSFAGALGKALNSLESSQATAETAASQVATGTSSDPEGAVVNVSNAELEMQLASQMRTKATEALNTIFQTQV
jgi:flagellar hook-basal body complex protein FliE